MNINIKIIESIIKDKILDENTTNEIIFAINKAIEDANAKKISNKVLNEKNKYMAVQLDNADQVYIFQGKESFQEDTLIDILKNKIVPEFNNSLSSKKFSVSSLSEAFEFVVNKFYKDYELSLKTKTPINIIRTENNL